MLPTIWLFIFLCYLYEVNSSLPETCSLSHLEPAADLNLKCEAEPALVTSSRPGTPCEGQSKQKLKNLQISESCVKEDGSDIDNRQKAPLPPAGPVHSRPLEQGSVEQSIHYPKGTKHFDNLHQAEGSNAYHSPVPPASSSRKPSFSDVPLGVLKPIYPDPLIPFVDYRGEQFLKIFGLKMIEPYYPLGMTQGHRTTSEIDSSKVTRSGKSSPVSSFETQIKQTKPEAALGQKMLWKPKSTKEITPLHLGSTSSRERTESAENLPNLSNPLKTSANALETPLSHSELDNLAIHDVIGKGEGKDNFKLSPLEKGKAVKYNEEEDPKKAKSATKLIHDELDFNIPHEQSDMQIPASKSTKNTELNDVLKIAPEPFSWKEKLLKKQTLAKNKIKESPHQNNFLKPNENFIAKTQHTVSHFNPMGQRGVRDEKLPGGLNSQLDPWKPSAIQSNENSLPTKEYTWTKVERKRKGRSFQFNPKTSKGNNVDEIEEKVFPLRLKNVMKQANKETSDIEGNNKAQESSEMSSTEDKTTSEPNSSDGLMMSESDVLGSDHLPTDTISKKEGRKGQEVIRGASPKSSKKKGKKNSKKKGTNRNSERQDNAHTSSAKEFDLSDMNVETALIPDDPPRNVNHYSQVNSNHNKMRPLPEPAFVVDSEISLPDLWQSQFYSSPVNLKALSGPLRQKAEMALELKWENMEKYIFAEAFEPGTSEQEQNQIHPNVPKLPTTFQLKINRFSEDEFREGLREHLKVLDETPNLTLGDLDVQLFNMLKERWFLDRKGLFTNLRETLKDFEEISESHKRLYTLSRQILQYTSVENWKEMKALLLETPNFLKSDVEDIERIFHLATRFPDITKPLHPSNQNTELVKRIKKKKKEIRLVLEEVMGSLEADIRIEIWAYLHENSNIRRWWEKKDYMEQYKGNGLNLCEVFSIGECLSFGLPTLEVSQEKALELLEKIEGIYLYRAPHVLPWYVSPERAFLTKYFEKDYVSRMKTFMRIERLHNKEKEPYDIALVHKTHRKQMQVVTLENEDIFLFWHNGLTPQYMTEMYLAGVGRAKKNEKKWRDFIGRAHNLLTEEQSSLTINWFMYANPRVKVMDYFENER